MEHWFYIIANLATFAGSPEEFGERYAPVVAAARLLTLPEKDLINYMNAMISDRERLDISTANYEAGYEDGKDAGRAEGLAEGKAEERVQMARKMLAAGIKPETVMEISGLSEEELEELEKA